MLPVSKNKITAQGVEIRTQRVELGATVNSSHALRANGAPSNLPGWDFRIFKDSLEAPILSLLNMNVYSSYTMPSPHHINMLGVRVEDNLSVLFHISVDQEELYLGSCTKESYQWALSTRGPGLDDKIPGCKAMV